MSKGKKYFITAGVCVLLAFFCFCGAAVTKDGDKYYLEKNQKKEKSYRTVGWFFALNAALDVCVGGYCLGAEVDSLLSKNNDERKIICPRCRKLVPATLTFCPYCSGEIRQKIEKPADWNMEDWECPKCHSKNPKHTTTCLNCSEPRKM